MCGGMNALPTGAHRTLRAPACQDPRERRKGGEVEATSNNVSSDRARPELQKALGRAVEENVVGPMNALVQRL